MNWTDEAIVLSVRPHGETAAVVELFTRLHGRHLGLVYGGRSRRLRPVLQIGNHVDATWKGRLAEHLGHFTIELKRGYAAETMEEPIALAGLTSLCALTRLLPERDPHPSLYEVSLFVMGFLADADVWPALLARWELALLNELGFGLDLMRCAATGRTDDLVYVSPRTGRAVSREAGEPYKDRLLSLPRFLSGSGGGGMGIAAANRNEAKVALELTGYFIEHRVLRPNDMPWPEARVRMLSLLPD